MPGVRDRNGAGSCKAAIPGLTIGEVADALYDKWFQREWQDLMRNFNDADAIPLPMTGPKVDDSLSRHGSVQPSLQQSNNRT